MTIGAWFTIVVIAAVIAALISNRISVDVAMVGGLTLLMAGDFVLHGLLNYGPILGVTEAIVGFAHPAIMMIGALFVVAAGLNETAGMEVIARKVLGRPKNIATAQIRLMAPVAVMSGFMNNTPIVAMYLPIVGDWCRKMRISPSKLFIPLSYASVLGGKLTYIGTASNIVVLGLFTQFLANDGTHQDWLQRTGATEMSSAMQFWGVGLIGLPCTIAGLAFIVLASKWLLPERKPAIDVRDDARKYEVMMEVRADSTVVGQSIEDAGLRNLPGLYLTEIEREGQTRTAVSPEERLRAGDILGFAGILESVVDLRKIKGLVPATDDQVQKVRREQAPRTLVEAVVSRDSSLVGKTVRDSQFRTAFNAAIIAVHRFGHRIEKKIGDIVLQQGDTLLLDTHAGFVKAHRNSKDFYLVSMVEGSRPVRHERAWIALSILAMFVVLLTVTSVHPVLAAFFCAMAMVGTRCTTGTIARESINWTVLIVIGSALAMGKAMETTGAAKAIAESLLDPCLALGMGPQSMLFVLFMIAAIFSQLITNNGAAVLMFPITMATAQQMNVPPEAFVFTLMVAAGSSFMSPVAYQTNLMVYTAGGYTFMDYVRLGTPLTLLTALVSTLVAPLVFNLTPAV